MKYAQIVTVKLVKEMEPMPTITVNGPKDVADFVRPLYEDYPVEVFSVLMLNTANRIRAFSVVSTGTLNSSLVDPGAVFQRVLLNNSKAIILVHNHPSGNLEPSGEDLRITRQLVDAGKLLDRPVHDHVIITPGGGYTSFAERGLI